MPVPDAQNEPNGNKNADTNRALATALAAGQPGTGFIASEGDEDWWKVDAPGETLIQWKRSSAPATSSNVDYHMEIFPARGDASLDSVVMGDGSGGITSLKTVVYGADAGSYFARIRDNGDDDYDTTQPYHVTATLIAVPDAQNEPNGNMNGDTNRTLATALPFRTPVRGWIAWRGDQDWYKVQAPAAGRVTIELSTTATSTDVDYRIALADAQGQEIGQEVDGDGSDGITRLRLQAQVPAAGTYFLVVSDNGDENYDYQNGYTLTASR
jgi:hypothetical protein